MGRVCSGDSAVNEHPDLMLNCFRRHDESEAPRGYPGNRASHPPDRPRGAVPKRVGSAPRTSRATGQAVKATARLRVDTAAQAEPRSETGSLCAMALPLH